MFAHIYRVSRTLAVVEPDAVDRVEQQIGVALPLAYRQFITTLGSGLYCGLVRVFAPEEIAQAYHDTHAAWRVYAHQYEDAAILAELAVATGLLIADTIDGDQIVFFPDQPHLFVFPHEDFHIYWLPDGLYDLLYWVGQAGVEQGPTPFHYFASWINRAHEVWFYGGSPGQSHLHTVVDGIIAAWQVPIAHVVYETTAEQRVALLFAPSIGARVTVSHDLVDETFSTIGIDYDQEGSASVADLDRLVGQFGFMRRAR